MRSLFVLVLLLGACGYNNAVGFRTDGGRPIISHKFPVLWKFDCGFPRSRARDIELAIRYWDDMTPMRLFRRVSCRSELASVTVSREGMDGDDGGANTWAATFTKTDDAGEWSSVKVEFYDIWDMANYGLRVSVARHEFGHVLGFLHGEDRTCLMYPSLDEGAFADSHLKDLCPAEEETFDRYYGIPKKEGSGPLR